jgi:hypothetical protein
VLANEGDFREDNVDRSAASAFGAVGILDRLRGVYDDGRSRDKGVEPEGVALLDIGGRTYAFIGLERTTQSSIAVFDITNPTDVGFVELIVTPGDLSPEGLAVYRYRGQDYLVVANEVPIVSGARSNTTLYRVDRVRPNEK